MKRVRNWLLCAIAIVLTATCMAACAGSCRKPTEPQTYTVSYAAGGGVGQPIDPQAYAAGTEIVLADNPFSREGYTFDGWAVAGGVFEAGATYTVYADVTFTASWTADDDTPDPPQPVTSYAVSFSANGGAGQAIEPKAYAAGTVIQLPANPFVREGYVFGGWNVGGAIYAAGANYTVEANSAFQAVWNEEGQPPVATYAVSFSANGGVGSAVETVNYIGGAEIRLPKSPFTNEGYLFGGWAIDDKTYAVNARFTVEQDSAFAAVWIREPHPAFSQERYEYDCIGGGDLELPFDLDGATIQYLEIDGDTTDRFSYDAQKKTIAVDEDFVLRLSRGVHTVRAITDSVGGDKTCTVSITQSHETAFDAVTYRTLRYGKEAGVTFAVDFNGCSVRKVMQGDLTIDPQYYSYDDRSFTLSADWIVKYGARTTFDVFLTNNEHYTFDVNSNVIFATDYDVTTEHDTLQSDTGQNSLYQHTSSVRIADGTDGMNGRVLQITPNTVANDAGCYGYLTLQTGIRPMSWRTLSFKAGKYYLIQFDYKTENTVTGNDIEFCLRSPAKQVPLLLGPENDGKVHAFSSIFTYAELDEGIMLRAKFLGGSGTVWVDNYRIIELDDMPTLGAAGDYRGSGDYTVSIDTKDYLPQDMTVKIDGVSVDFTYAQNAITIPASAMQTLELKEHTLTVDVWQLSIETKFSAIDGRVAEFTETRKTYRSALDSEVSFAGSFSDTVALTSLKQKARTGDLYSGNDTTTDFKAQASLRTGENGSGALVLPKSFMDKFWGEVTFVATFNNGVTREITVENADTKFLINYDETRFGYEWLLHSGLLGSATIDVADRVDGESGKAFYIRNRNNIGAAFTLKYHDCNMDWYSVDGTVGHSYRVTFDYRISDLAGANVYFDLGYASGTAIDSYVYGKYDKIVKETSYDWAVFALRNDGQTHTFDSGWFTCADGALISEIEFANFAAADDRFIMIDNYRIVTTEQNRNVLRDLGDYTKEQTAAYRIDLGGETPVSLTLNGNNVAYTLSGAYAVLSSAALDALDCGQYTLVLETDAGRYSRDVWILANSEGVIEFDSTRKSFRSLSEENVTFTGNFGNSINLISFKQKAKTWNDGKYTQYNYTKSNDTTTDFKNEISYWKGTDGTLTIPKSFLDRFFGETTFIATFDNGTQVELTVDIEDILLNSNFDESYIFDFVDSQWWWNYSEFYSGLSNNSGKQLNIEERPDGAGKALYIRSTEGCVEGTAFTVNLHEGKWDWLELSGVAGRKYRITFDYAVSQNFADKKFEFQYLMDNGTNFADYGITGLDRTAHDDGSGGYERGFRDLIKDGQVHTFDSGWFTCHEKFCAAFLNFDKFTAADNGYFMLDNYKIETAETVPQMRAPVRKQTAAQRETTATPKAEADYTVEGGRLTYNFEDPSQADDFDLYTERGERPAIQFGRLYCELYAEQKIILKDHVFGDVDISVDLIALAAKGQIQAGIYVGASNAGNARDAITGWCVQITHGVTYWVNSNPNYEVWLYRYENGKYKSGIKAARDLTYTGAPVNLRVVVKNGTLSVFVDGGLTPCLTHNVGELSGAVGLRGFITPCAFDNLTIVSPALAADKTALYPLVSQARAKLDGALVTVSREALSAAIAQAEAAETQAEIDAAAVALSEAIARAVEVSTFAELTATIAEADALDNPQGRVYTVNSWNALLAVKNRCKQLTADSDEREIAYWCGRLRERIDNLVAYL